MRTVPTAAQWHRRLRSASAVAISAVALCAVAACSDPATGSDAAGASDANGDGGGDAAGGADPVAQAALLGVPESERWTLPGLKSEVHVVRTEGNVPHIYASNRTDLARVMGFVAARDRFFLMDMMRRLGLGRVSEVFGSLALSADAQSRGSGMTAVADRVLTQIRPEMKEILGAYAEGVNAYIDQVKAGALPPPSELKLAAPLLGFKSPSDAMYPFDLRDMAGMLAVVLFQQGYETDDIRRAHHRRQMATMAGGAAPLSQHGAALRADVLDRVEPMFAETTAPGFGVNGEWTPPAPPPPAAERPADLARPVGIDGAAPSMPMSVLDRLRRTATALSQRLGKPERGAFGSNIWVVGGSKAKDGAAILASDGHLELSVPSLFWRIGLDTRVFGGGDLHQLGLTFAGLPLLGAGTNGSIAWSNTYLYGDITDYYAEQVTLGSDGRPASVLHKGEQKALVEVKEVYGTAKIALLQSPGGDRERRRYETWDGRRLVGIEGRVPTDAEVADPTTLAKGEALVDVLGDLVVAGDEDGDGVISGISMDLTTFDVADTPGAIDAIGHATTVDAFREATRHFVGWAQNMMAVDAAGNALYTSYNATPCRTQLPRGKDGFVAGAHPRDLIDGTKYAGFRIAVVDGKVDEAAGAQDPAACIVPFAAWPVARNPASGVIVNANNDISGTSLDGTIGNDAWYMGGTWVLGLRAHAIAEGLADAAKDGAITTDEMAAVQGTHRSLLGCRLGPAFVAALDRAEAASKIGGSASAEDTELGALWLADAATLTIVRTKLQAWQTRGCPAESGVETFYHAPTSEQRADAIATTLWNGWLVEALHDTFDDEGVALDPLEALRGFALALEGRGAGNPKGLQGWDAATAESVLFDSLGTAAVERSDAVLVQALHHALARLRAKPKSPGVGGYGTDDVEQWLWGLRHQVTFDSILASFLVGVAGLDGLLDAFSITPDVHPLADKLDKSDPRKGLRGFPRAGDYGAVDAAAPNAVRGAVYGDPGATPAERDMTYSHGPIMRMVIALHGPDADHPVGRIEGRTILPGGQSALNDSPFFADQVKLWLANKTQPMRFSPKEVVAGATGREVYAAP